MQFNISQGLVACARSTEVTVLFICLDEPSVCYEKCFRGSGGARGGSGATPSLRTVHKYSMKMI